MDAFQDENKTEAMVLAGLAADKHARKMAEHDQRMAELELKKQKLNLEATGKQLEAEDRRMVAQHQREREKERHDMEMLRLRLQFQGVSGGSGVRSLAVAGAQFGVEPQEQFVDANTSQFADPNAFGNLGMGMHGTHIDLNVPFDTNNFGFF